MSKTTAEEKEWSQLSIAEKLKELGFDKDTVYEQRVDATTVRRHDGFDAQIHTALDQLLDAGGMLVEIEAMTQPAGTGKPTGDELNICASIYSMLTIEEDEEIENPV